MFGHQDDDNTDMNGAATTNVAAFPPADLLNDNPAASPTVGEPSQPTEPVAVNSYAPTEPAAVVPALPADDLITSTASTDDLISIKQSALQQLSPLVGQLDQSPEEKFRTTMMMIQASDDQSLIKTAYAAAQQIEDEKAKAQALLDVVNEINYFTQHQA